MPIQEDIKRERAEEDGEEQSTENSGGEAGTTALSDELNASAAGENREEDGEPRSDDDREAPEGDRDEEPAVAPTQLGDRRFVYAAYFAGGIGIAFVVSKALTLAWYRLQTWKPAVGEPRDEIVMPVAALIGVGAAVYYWYRTRARQLAEEVAAEMSKVTWPSRTEVQNGTFVVIVTTVVATMFFFLMDEFWGFVTKQVYGGT